MIWGFSWCGRNFDVLPPGPCMYGEQLAAFHHVVGSLLRWKRMNLREHMEDSVLFVFRPWKWSDPQGICHLPSTSLALTGQQTHGTCNCKVENFRHLQERAETMSPPINACESYLRDSGDGSTEFVCNERRSQRLQLVNSQSMHQGLSNTFRLFVSHPLLERRRSGWLVERHDIGQSPTDHSDSTHIVTVYF